MLSSFSVNICKLFGNKFQSKHSFILYLFRLIDFFFLQCTIATLKKAETCNTVNNSPHSLCFVHLIIFLTISLELFTFAQISLDLGAKTVKTARNICTAEKCELNRMYTIGVRKKKHNAHTHTPSIFDSVFVICFIVFSSPLEATKFLAVPSSLYLCALFAVLQCVLARNA